MTVLDAKVVVKLLFAFVSDRGLSNSVVTNKCLPLGSTSCRFHSTASWSQRAGQQSRELVELWCPSQGQ